MHLARSRLHLERVASRGVSGSYNGASPIGESSKRAHLVVLARDGEQLHVEAEHGVHVVDARSRVEGLTMGLGE